MVAWHFVRQLQLLTVKKGAEEVVEAGDGEVVGGGARGRRWEGWATGCGMGTDGDQLADRVRSPQVADTSEQGEQN